MTVSSEVNYIEYNGDGVTTTFPIPFYFILNSDISAQIADADGNITDLTYGVDYSVSGAGSSSGGSATMNTAYASGYKILFYREPPATQETAYYENGKFPAKSHEKALDKLTMLIQSCFSGLGLALRKPSFMANYYDALNNKIRNLQDPSEAQDAATKNYVDIKYEDGINHSDNNFKRTLRVPETYVPEYFVQSIRANMLVGCNDQGNFVPIAGQTDTADLAIKLASLGGSSLIGGLGFLTPEMFGAKRDGVSDDSEAVLLAIERASAGPTKIIWVGGGKYLCDTVNFNVPSGVSIIGGGAGSGFIFPTPPSSAMHEFFTLAGNGSLLKDFSIQFNTGGLGSIGAVQAYGVWFKDTSTNCVSDGLVIDGKYSDSVMGFSNGFRLSGQDNTLRNCVVTHCSMGVTVRGTRLSILDSHFDNGYTTEDGTAWTSSKPQWDGIACEGILDCLISGNICTNNGQSGIYIGGGGAGYSSGNIITDNRCFHNWNRGMDTGISGTQSPTNDVTNFTITDNHLRDNRETQLWLYGTNNSRISNNSVIETSEYNTIFGSQASSTRAGIALGLSSACVNNVIEGNTVIVQSTTPYSVVYNGTGHKISASNRILGGQTTYIFGTDALRLYSNNVEFYQGTFTPQLIVGSGLTLSSSTGRYTIKSGRVNFDISLTITASSPTGALTIGYIPGVSSASLRDRSYNVDIYNGWNTTLGNSTLRAIQGTSQDQIQVVRLLNGSYGQDAAAYAATGCTIHIHGYVETSPTYSGV